MPNRTWTPNNKEQQLKAYQRMDMKVEEGDIFVGEIFTDIKLFIFLITKILFAAISIAFLVFAFGWGIFANVMASFCHNVIEKYTRTQIFDFMSQITVGTFLILAVVFYFWPSAIINKL